ncbi:MAG: hypothetical protein AA908_10365 [Chlorobi bacterium NICIL-2]|nr:MAG: hypothetical protein AA908_10365 [Chlorobi bacterium NICIL-2]
MFAEAENEINNGPTPAAINAFLQVRKRAFAGNPSRVGTPPADKQGFFNAIVNERAWEFGGEGIRKYDLIRWNLLGTMLNNTKAALQAMANGQPPYNNLPSKMYYKLNSTTLIWGNSFYQPAPATTPSGYGSVNWVSSSMLTSNSLNKYAEGFTAGKTELFPFPQAIISANPNLVQNPGY